MDGLKYLGLLTDSPSTVGLAPTAASNPASTTSTVKITKPMPACAMASPKRKSQRIDTSIDENASKKPRVEATEAPQQGEIATEATQSDPSAAPDSFINHKAAIAYWSSTPATVDGVLGGYPQVSRVDLQGSANFLAKLRRQSKIFSPSKGKLKRVVDCGAGIGRVTKGFLSNVSETVDIVEPVKAFTDQVKDEPCVGVIYSVGLEQWDLEGSGPYDVIWNQWCVGQLTDAQLVAYLQRLPSVLCAGGWIVVKENLSTSAQDEDIYDDTDSSVTRTDTKFRSLFVQAGLKLVASEVQRGMPAELYPVRTYALQPK